VSVETIKRLERTIGQVSANVATVKSILGILEAAGVEFTNSEQPGVRLRKSSATAAAHDQIIDPRD
jgi:hypothetical protein